MRDSDSRVSVAMLRAAAQRAVELQSTRTVAAAMGISAAGLRHFLKGGTPYHRTARKLMAWYAHHGRELPGLSVDVAEAALTMLTESVPEELRPAARETIVAGVRSLCERHGHRPPAWTEPYRADPHSAPGLPPDQDLLRTR